MQNYKQEQKENWLIANWQAYLTGAKSVDEIKRRLKEVPEAMRERVTIHARQVYKLRQSK